MPPEKKIEDGKRTEHNKQNTLYCHTEINTTAQRD